MNTVRSIGFTLFAGLLAILQAGCSHYIVRPLKATFDLPASAGKRDLDLTFTVNDQSKKAAIKDMGGTGWSIDLQPLIEPLDFKGDPGTLNFDTFVNADWANSGIKISFNFTGNTGQQNIIYTAQQAASNTYTAKFDYHAPPGSDPSKNIDFSGTIQFTVEKQSPIPGM
jgi:hypothetical protein